MRRYLYSFFLKIPISSTKGLRHSRNIWICFQAFVHEHIILILNSPLYLIYAFQRNKTCQKDVYHFLCRITGDSIFSRLECVRHKKLLIDLRQNPPDTEPLYHTDMFNTNSFICQPKLRRPELAWCHGSLIRSYLRCGGRYRLSAHKNVIYSPYHVEVSREVLKYVHAAIIISRLFWKLFVARRSSLDVETKFELLHTRWKWAQVSDVVGCYVRAKAENWHAWVAERLNTGCINNTGLTAGILWYYRGQKW